MCVCFTNLESLGLMYTGLPVLLVVRDCQLIVTEDRERM